VRIRLALDARKLTDFGIGTYVTQLVAGLETRPEVELTLLVPADLEGRARALAPSARLVPVSAAGYSLAEHLQLPLATWREKVDLVHIPHYVLPALMTRPAVVTVHDVIQLFYPPRRRQQLALLYVRWMMRSTLRRARRVITVSRSSRQDLINLFAADRERVVAVPNGVDPGLAERPPAETLEALRARYGLRCPLLLVVANDKPHKNCDLVLRAFHLAVRRHGLPGQLVYVGGVEQGSRLARRARRLGIDDRVRFLGRVPRADLWGLYHLASVLVHVALYEGFGLPVLEAMQCGLPVVASNVGALRELGEGVARLVNPLDIGEVVDTVQQVLVDDPLRRRMIEAGQRRAEKHSWEKSVERTVAIYEQALGEV